MKKFLKLLFGLIIVFMVYVITTTSLQSNLFYLMKHWGDKSVDTYPWFSATLYDFYCNVLAFYCWVLYKETTLLSRIVWLLLLVLMGSPATAAYILVQIFRMKEGEGFSVLLTKQN